MTAIAASSTAMTAVAESSTAMTAVAASQTAMAAVVDTAVGKAALMAANDILQSLRTTIYNTIKTTWTKHRHVILNSARSNGALETGSSALAEPANALIFVCMGVHSTAHRGQHILYHPSGEFAAQSGNLVAPNAMTEVSGVSFAGAKVKQGSSNHGHTYAEVWSKT